MLDGSSSGRRSRRRCIERSRGHALRLLWLGLSGLLTGCASQPPPSRPAAPAEAKPAEAPVVWQFSKTGVGFRLSDADPDVVPPKKPARTKPLTDAEAQAVLSRLPPQKPETETKPFALREKSLPAPRPGETIKTPFPVAEPGPRPPDVASPSSLSVLRYNPEGPVDIAPHLSVTFSEPMVPLTSVTELTKEQAPLVLEPMPPGHFRWLGTRTVLFEPEGERFPMATDYTVTVPESVRSANGVAIDKRTSFSFSTPTVRVTGFHPSYYAPQELDPYFFASFNQRVEPARVLEHVALESRHGTHQLVLLGPEEVETNRTLRSLEQSAGDGKWVAFRAAEQLPKHTSFSVRFKRGLPSAEGPKPTESDQSHSFFTYGPLELQTLRCAWYDSCPPQAPWTLSFTNPLDADSFDRSLISVEPALDAMKVSVTGNTLVVSGRSKGRTKYTVTVAKGLRDRFGQTLGKAATASVEVGRAKPMLFSEQSNFIVADPAVAPRLSVYSVNRDRLRVRLYRVAPEDWPRFLRFYYEYDEDGRKAVPPGRLAFDRVIQVLRRPDELVETQIDLSSTLTEGTGQTVAVVDTVGGPDRDRWGNPIRERVRVWVQATRIGLQAFWDADHLYGWASALDDGTSLADVNVFVPQGGPSAMTGPDGLARLPLGDRGGIGIVARRGQDTAFLPVQTYYWNERAVTREFPGERVRWFVYDDRGLYKPGEKVSVKGWIRIADLTKGGDLRRLALLTGAEVGYQVYDPRGNEIAKGTAEVDDSGGFSLTFSLPANANLGSGRISFGFGGLHSDYSHEFRIEEFRRPEYEVSATLSEGPFFVGSHAIATATASYYTGGGLPSAEVAWKVTPKEASFVPPNSDTFHFGRAPRFWWDRESLAEAETWTARTGASGSHRLRIDLDAVAPHFAKNLDLEATITDVNRQAWTARASLLVHPGNVYVGLRQQSSFVRAGQNLSFESIVTDLDGNRVSGRNVELTLARLVWEQVGSRYEERETDVRTCSMSSNDKPERCSLPTEHAGRYRALATVTDEHERKSQTELYLWVLGDDEPENPNVKPNHVELVPDKKEYRAGETAKLLVVAPFAPAEGVLTVRRQGIEELRRFSLQRQSEVLEVKIDDRYVPNVIARVDLVGSDVRENEIGERDVRLPRRPAFASGSVRLGVPPLDRTLAIEIRPEREHLKPGGKTKVDILVTDAANRPVASSRVALVVADESVLALTGYKTPDPIEVFYTDRAEGVNDLELRFRVALTRPEMALGADESLLERQSNGHARPSMPARVKKSAMTGAPAFAEEVMRDTASFAPVAAAAPPGQPGTPDQPIALRADFSALAAFVPNVQTDARGRATVPIKLPDNLTRYRIMAVAAAGENRFGKSESSVTARLPLMVRASPPRFLNYGDRFELPVVIQNQTDRPFVADVAARAQNATLIGAQGLRVEVPANDRVEVRFPSTTKLAGTARYEVAASSSAGADASEHELPVWTPATTEAFATYGQIDAGAVKQPLKVPGDAVPHFGGLELTTSSTGLQGLTDAFIYLWSYPFECNEQLASRVLATAALRDVLQAFNAPGMPSAAALKARMAQDAEKLAQRQHWSGGWDYWRKDSEPSPYVSIHVTHALLRMQEKGYKVNAEVLDRALSYVRGVRHRIPRWYSEESKLSLLAYTHWVLDRAKRPQRAEARDLITQASGVSKLPLEAVGWLLPVLSKDPAAAELVEQMRRRIGNDVTETAGNAHFVTSYSDGAYVLLHSARRADGILLEALIADAPQNDLIPKIVKGLLAHRKRGRWYNTQENAFVLLALDAYFQTYEKLEPDFVARAWIGDTFIADHRYKGRSTDRTNVTVPMAALTALPSPAPIIVQKEGTGRLYYRLGLEYAPKKTRLPPVDAGFEVTRLYEAVDAPEDVKRDDQGVWQVRAGALVRVKLNMVAQARRYHVALVDPLPAGFEPLNPSLAVTGTIPSDPKATVPRGYFWRSTWYEHQNLRDERVEAFASLLWEGVHDYSYVARATTPGRFVVPPPKAEEMYDPETFGRGASDVVIVR